MDELLVCAQGWENMCLAPTRIRRPACWCPRVGEHFSRRIPKSTFCLFCPRVVWMSVRPPVVWISVRPFVARMLVRSLVGRMQVQPVRWKDVNSSIRWKITVRPFVERMSVRPSLGSGSCEAAFAILSTGRCARGLVKRAVRRGLCQRGVCGG